MARKLFKLAPFVSIILKRDNQILLIMRTNTGFADGLYGMPGGSVDGGQTVAQSACREAKEELGITVVPEDLEVVHVCHINGEGDFEALGFYLETTKWQGEPTNAEPHLHDHIAWFDINKLPENTMSIIKFNIGYILQNKVYSEFGWDSELGWNAEFKK